MKRILIVEDDLSQAQLLARWLEADGDYKVDIAENGLKGFEIVKKSPWDLIISDVYMPQMDGLDFVKFVKMTVPETPALLITSEESMEMAIKALQHKADDLLTKPISRTAIVDKVAEMIERSEYDVSRKRINILAIGAHPDDVEIGCGGVLARHSRKGDNITILTLSDGEIGGDTNERRKESQAAAEDIRATLVWGNLKDTQITDSRGTISIIEEAIQQAKPQIIYTHSANDAHQDHRNAFSASIVAGRKVQNLYCYQSPSSTIDFRPTSFTDISDFLEEKQNLVSHFSSQVAKANYLNSEFIESTARYWGRFAGYKKVEPFEVIRESK
ncbi:MAG: response regulator [Pyrinomonadaceae bacterium]